MHRRPRQHYNSAEPEAAGCGFTGSSDSTMNSNDSALSEEKFRPHDADLLTITDAIPIGISVLAPDGTTLYVNRVGP